MEFILKEDKDIIASDLDCITVATTRVIDCRRILKWSYVFGYDLTRASAIGKYLFEDHQGQIEMYCEKLQTKLNAVPMLRECKKAVEDDGRVRPPLRPLSLSLINTDIAHT
jgi:hypothetical protein